MSNTEKRQNRIDRYKELARRAEQRSQDAFDRSNRSVARHSRRAADSCGASFREAAPCGIGVQSECFGAIGQRAGKAEYYRRKAEAAANNNAIYTEDEDSIERLEDKIAFLEKVQQAMKDRNKIIRAKLSDDEKVARLVKLGMEEQDARALLVPDFCGRVGYPALQAGEQQCDAPYCEEAPRKRPAAQIPRAERI